MAKYFLLVDNDDKIVGTVRRASISWIVTYEGTTDILYDRDYKKFLADHALHTEVI